VGVLLNSPGPSFQQQHSTPHPPGALQACKLPVGASVTHCFLAAALPCFVSGPLWHRHRDAAPGCGWRAKQQHPMQAHVRSAEELVLSMPCQAVPCCGQFEWSVVSVLACRARFFYKSVWCRDVWHASFWHQTQVPVGPCGCYLHLQYSGICCSHLVFVAGPRESLHCLQAMTRSVPVMRPPPPAPPPPPVCINMPSEGSSAQTGFTGPKQAVSLSLLGNE